MEKKLPFILIGLFVFCYFFGGSIPLETQQWFYSVSLSIKQGLTFVLPFIIFTFLFSGLVGLRGLAFKFVLTLVPSIILSSFIALQVAYIFGKFVFVKHFALEPVNISNALEPLWNFELQPLITSNQALLLSLFLGILLPFVSFSLSNTLAKGMTRIANLILHYIFLPVIPVFVFGFLLYIDHGGYLKLMVEKYFWMFFTVIVLAYGYITLLYLIGQGFNIKKTKEAILNILPALMTGFSTMSSAMAMPLTIQATEKNLPHSPTAKAIIPAITNPHLLGDAISISLFAFTVLIAFGQDFPSLENYIPFCLFLIYYKFGAVGIPGGGIIVLLPVLEQYLGFNSPMISLMTAIYILFDPFITSANIYGNGGFAILFTKLFEGRRK